MTDSNQAPNPSPSSSPGYEGTDPDLPDRSDREKEGPRIGVSTVQVGASAAAAVTSALAASFFGVAGTLIGAAVGSVVSTIAGALYADYLRRAGERIRVTRSVVIQRIPSEVLTTTPLRHLTRPTDLPGQQSLRPIGDERGDESVTVPVQDAAELRRHPEGMAPLDQTSVLPTINGSEASRNPVPGPPAPLWKRPVVAMAAVSAAGFMIAIGIVLATETVIGHPVSGGDGGNTLSRLGNTSSQSEITTPEKTTPSETEAPSATAEAPVVPTPSTDPTAIGGTESEPTQESTSESTSEPTEPGAEATDPGAVGDPQVGDDAGADADSGIAATEGP
jgi:hypothetical protein